MNQGPSLAACFSGGIRPSCSSSKFISYRIRRSSSYCTSTGRRSRLPPNHRVREALFGQERKFSRSKWFPRTGRSIKSLRRGTFRRGAYEAAGVLERGRHQRAIGVSPRLRELLRDLCPLLSFPLRFESNAEAIE